MHVARELLVVLGLLSLVVVRLVFDLLQRSFQLFILQCLVFLELFNLARHAPLLHVEVGARLRLQTVQLLDAQLQLVDIRAHFESLPLLHAEQLLVLDLLEVLLFLVLLDVSLDATDHVLVRKLLVVVPLLQLFVVAVLELLVDLIGHDRLQFDLSNLLQCHLQHFQHPDVHKILAKVDLFKFFVVAEEVFVDSECSFICQIVVAEVDPHQVAISFERLGELESSLVRQAILTEVEFREAALGVLERDREYGQSFPRHLVTVEVELLQALVRLHCLGKLAAERVSQVALGEREHFECGTRSDDVVDLRERVRRIQIVPVHDQLLQVVVRLEGEDEGAEAFMGHASLAEVQMLEFAPGLGEGLRDDLQAFVADLVCLEVQLEQALVLVDELLYQVG